ncbi:APC family permease [Streptomyces sp. HNM0574]|uniref:APC family permease n=1 Tax=Streptomyces sp. HNM0574 TaxID=2714954 RepID=UPI00146C3310|nr:APC family permease [Streptomyces sp. HNM0574]NLU70495.1 APC family permease [Streptomyces sp. HNM0574]
MPLTPSATDGSPAVAGPPPSAPAPQRRIGVPGIVFFIVAASAPLTVAAGGFTQALGVTGVLGIPVLYAAIAVVLALFTSGYAAMSRHITGAGAFYAYAAQGLGRPAGVGTAFVALVAYNAMQVGLAGLFGATTAEFVEARTGVEVPWWALVLAVTALVGVLGYRRVDVSAKVLAVLLAVEFAVVLAFDLGQLGHAPQGLSTVPLTLHSALDGQLGVALCFVFGSYMGFESAALYSDECRDPKRTVARATYTAVAVVGLFYAFSSWAMIVGAGPDRAVGMAQQQGPELLFTLGSDALGPLFADLSQLFLITSILASLVSFHNAVARYVRSLGREQVLPRGLGALHPRHGSPYRGSLLQTVVTVAVTVAFAAAGRDPVADVFTWLTNLGAVGVILLMLVTSVSVVAFFARRQHLGTGERLWHRVVAPVLAAIPLAVIFWLALSTFSVQLGVAPGNPLRWILPGLIVASAAAGLAWGHHLRRSRPTAYARIGTSRAE